MRVALAQINPTVGDIRGNEAKVREQLARARQAGAQLALVPELAISGYPPEDLLLKEHFLADARAAVERIAADVRGIVALVGFPERSDDAYNAAAVLADGRVQAIYRKVNLPNYGVFDELRYFQRGPGGATIDVDGVKVGLTICEDIWVPGAPMTDEALAGARLVLNISASPYQAGKGRQREQMIAQRARDNLAAVAFCALVGGQDELVFDGHSFVVDHDGNVIARAAQFAEELLVCDVDVEAAGAARLRDTRARPAAREVANTVADLGSFTTDGGSDPAAPGGPVAELLDADAEIYAALVLGTRDYVTKNGFQHVVLGLSGGIDSTLVALIAVDALGPERVTCVTMPSPYSSQGTRNDAYQLAENLGIGLVELPIGEAMAGYEDLLADVFAGRRAGHHRGEPAGAHPRQPPDGAVEQVRVAGAHHRQQVRDVGRLLDALRRQRGRLRGHQGLPEDARLPARGRALAPRSPVAGAGVDRHPRAVRRVAPRPARPGLAAALRRARRHPGGLRRAGPRARAAHRPGPAGGRRRPRHPPRRPLRVQAPPEPAGDQGHLEGIRARPPGAHRQPLRRMIALVTGAGNPRGIGAACVRALADRGATVAFTVMPGETAPDDLPGTAFTTDLSEAVAPERLMDAVTEQIGHPSVLVNNAAHSTRDGFAALDAAGIDAHYAVNVRAPMLLSVLLARAERHGRIVNLISGQFLGPMPASWPTRPARGRWRRSRASSRPRSPTSA